MKIRDKCHPISCHEVVKSFLIKMVVFTILMCTKHTMSTETAKCSIMYTYILNALFSVSAAFLLNSNLG